MSTAPTIREHAVVRIDGRTFPFTTFAEVSAAYRATIERLGLGGSETPSCDILDDAGRQTAHVSYNGRVWEGRDLDWNQSTRCLYDPRPAAGVPGALSPERMAA